MFQWLRNQGHPWNHKRVYRIYCDLRLNLRIKPKRRLPSRHPDKLATPARPNDTWSVDFMTDTLETNQRFRTLNIIDDFNREVVHIEVGPSIPAQRVIRALEFAAEQYSYPRRLRTDNGPEFISQALRDWCIERQVAIDFIRPGTPTENAYIERFNRTFREEVLDLYRFSSLTEVQDTVTRWCWMYNRERPHQALKGMAPVAYRHEWNRHHNPEKSLLTAVL